MSELPPEYHSSAPDDPAGGDIVSLELPADAAARWFAESIEVQELYCAVRGVEVPLFDAYETTYQAAHRFAFAAVFFVAYTHEVTLEELSSMSRSFFYFWEHPEEEDRSLTLKDFFACSRPRLALTSLASQLALGMATWPRGGDPAFRAGLEGGVAGALALLQECLDQGELLAWRSIIQRVLSAQGIRDEGIQ